ncbi:MAG TPA: DNA repair protein RecO [Verrucomicrobiae bacterium]|nr:DNA repair protein RecO [Verrucomicrobiae bacterium]
MDTERVEAIVLRKQSVTESSLIVTWFTREVGKLKTLAKGARRPKGPFQGKIDLFYRDEIVFLRSRRSDLHLLHDCFLEDPHKELRDSVGALTAASYVGELVDLATEWEDPNPKLFDVLAATLDALGIQRGRTAAIIWFELQLLAAAGWAPQWEPRTAVTRVLESLSATGLEGARRVRLSESQIADARGVVWQLLDSQLGRAPRSRTLLTKTVLQ